MKSFDQNPHKFLTVARIEQFAPYWRGHFFCFVCDAEVLTSCQSCKAPFCRARACRVAHVRKENSR